jgi:hypothetical protein
MYANTSMMELVKDRRGDQRGVNESQSKFLNGTWPISQNQPETPLLYLVQDWLAIDKLSAFGSGLGNTPETRNGASEITWEFDNINRLRKQFISSRAFHRTLGGRVRETTSGEQFRPQIL